MNICELLENTNNTHSVLNEEEQNDQKIPPIDAVFHTPSSNDSEQNDMSNKENKIMGSVYASSDDLSKTGQESVTSTSSSSEAMDTSEDDDDVDYNSERKIGLILIIL